MIYSIVIIGIIAMFFYWAFDRADFIEYENIHHNDDDLDPTELFQATKNLKVDTSSFKKDESKYDQEEGLFDECKRKPNE